MKRIECQGGRIAFEAEGCQECGRGVDRLVITSEYSGDPKQQIVQGEAAQVLWEALSESAARNFHTYAGVPQL